MSYKNEKPKRRRTISLLLGDLVINILGTREKGQLLGNINFIVYTIIFRLGSSVSFKQTPG